MAATFGPLADDDPVWVGTCAALREAQVRIARFAATTATVLVQGETGTGKELAARRIHYSGTRAEQPFIALNCGALPDTLVEAELFGNTRGAFTDAREARQGVIEQAQRGTLFLDEVEALSPRAQIVLLRFLQDHCYRPVGSDRERRADVRVIAASNQNLADLAKRGAYREDLVYRLAVLTVTLPALRHRGDDVLLLAQHFLREFAAQYGTGPKRLGAGSRDFLRSHSWPGNVRELQNMVHRQFVLADGDCVDILNPEREPASPPPPDEPATDDDLAQTFQMAKQHAMATFERRFLTAVLQSCGGNVSLAARRAGKERRAFGKLLKKHGLDRERFLPRLGAAR